MKVKMLDRFGNERNVEERIARVLEKRGKMAYQTRMLTADEGLYSTNPTPPEPEPEVDSAGDVWNPDMHVSTKLQNQDGTWRKKPGAKAAEAE